MSTVPQLPDTAPFSPEQRAWLNGFLAGIFSRGGTPGIANHPAQQSTTGAAAALTPLTILFGTQTGTAESLAKQAAKEASKRGFAASAVDMAQTSPSQLAQEKAVLVITSTYGDGEPPDNAKALHTALAASTAPALTGLRFSVCALGDTNYTAFCKCGADFDNYLEKLGAARVTPRVDCDLDYESAFKTWLDTALAALASVAPADTATAQPIIGTALTSGAPTPTPQPSLSHRQSAEPPAPLAFSRQNPYPARLLVTRSLNGAGSAKQVNHVEFSLADSGLVYEAGDALGVYPQNCHELVGDVLTALGCDGEEAVATPDGSTTSLRHALTTHYDLGKPSADLLAAYHANSASTCGSGVAVVLHHVIDVVHARPDVKLAPADFVRTLKKLQPRLYSISSSPVAHAGRVHLTVGAVRYDAAGRARKGVCSTFLAERAAAGHAFVPVFIHGNKAFRLPSAPDTPIIMVGPGTGIAPFRAFLHERRATGATGRNWLLFGDQRATTDFLYRDELEAMQRDGTLTRLDTAFSRDQSEKVYVQHRMLAAGTELYAWLEAGAHFYVCGEASRMAKDVDAALHEVIARAGGKSADEAATYVQALKTAKRYQRDVY